MLTRHAREYRLPLQLLVLVQHFKAGFMSHPAAIEQSLFCPGQQRRVGMRLRASIFSMVDKVIANIHYHAANHRKYSCSP